MFAYNLVGIRNFLVEMAKLFNRLRSKGTEIEKRRQRELRNFLNIQSETRNVTRLAENSFVDHNDQYILALKFSNCLRPFLFSIPLASWHFLSYNYVVQSYA